MSAYTVRLPVFEGPLDLLLALIRRAELDITAVAIAKVTDQYLAHVSALEIVDPVAVASFCEVTTTLMLIKSRTLLPRPPAPEADDDPDAQILAERLRAYQRFQRVAQGLQAREQAGLRVFTRAAPPPDLPPKLDPGGVAAADLMAAFAAALAEAEALAAADAPAPGGPAVPAPRIRLAERLAEVRRLLVERRRVTFRDVLLGGRLDREFIVVSFLAVLELLRRAAIRAIQPDLFGEIVLELRPEAGAGWDLDRPGDDAPFVVDGPPFHETLAGAPAV